jgi:hypothetical protein
LKTYIKRYYLRFSAAKLIGLCLKQNSPGYKHGTVNKIFLYVSASAVAQGIAGITAPGLVHGPTAIFVLPGSFCIEAPFPFPPGIVQA